MCGIVGYIGTHRAVPIILEGLKRLEYRGYDSAGLAVYCDDAQLAVRRAKGKLRNLEEAIRMSPVDGAFGIGHTRWATHGRPTEENAHPHRDCKGDIVVVHNGIVENYLQLKQQLESEGHKFITQTDTEIIAHLIEKYFQGNLEEAVRTSVKQLTGVFALAVIARSDPNKIVAARYGPPVVIGIGDNEYFVASDVPAILAHTQDMFFLADGDMAILTPRGRPAQRFRWPSRGSPGLAYSVEPRSRPKRAATSTSCSKKFLSSPAPFAIPRSDAWGRKPAGSSWTRWISRPKSLPASARSKLSPAARAGMPRLAGKFMIEKLARIPVEVDYGSEFRYRDPIVGEDTLTVVISQSGETADTLAAQREAKQKGSKTLAICNVVGSMITREAAGTIYTHAGPEIGVASTKAFTCQLTSLFILAMHLGQANKRLDESVVALPGSGAAAASRQNRDDPFARCGSTRRWPKACTTARTLCSSAAASTIPIALEGALKLKEISYIHAEGYPAGEMKHGPNALIDENLPVVVLATRDPNSDESRVLYEKTLSNIQEVKAREGVVVAVVTRRRRRSRKTADHVIEFPPTSEFLRRSSKLCRCNCWPTTSPSAADATSISLATWPRA